MRVSGNDVKNSNYHYQQQQQQQREINRINLLKKNLEVKTNFSNKQSNRQGSGKYNGNNAYNYFGNNFGNNNYNNNNFGGNYNYNFSNDTISDDISVIYYVNLELADNEDRRYFKKMEINLFRLDDEFYRQSRNRNNNYINYLFCRNKSKNDNIVIPSNKENNDSSSFRNYEEKIEKKDKEEDILNSNIMKIRGLFK
jgi:hypothetical protein